MNKLKIFSMEQIKHFLSFLLASLSTLIFMFAVPISYAADIETYQKGSGSDITVMLTLDMSGSMSAATRAPPIGNGTSLGTNFGGATACDMPSGSGFGSFGYESFSNKYQSKHSGISFNYDRVYCLQSLGLSVYHRATNFLLTDNVDRYYQASWQYCLDEEGNRAFNRTYDQCKWGAVLYANQSGEICQPGSPNCRKCSAYQIDKNPFSTGIQPWRTNTTKCLDGSTTWTYLPGNATIYTGLGPTVSTKYYDRITKLKDAMYEVLYGANALSDDKKVGLSFFPNEREGFQAYAGRIVVPARRLDASTGITLNGRALNQRELLMQRVAEAQVHVYTPTIYAYAEVAAYMLGTNTFLSATRLEATTGHQVNWRRCMPSNTTDSARIRSRGYSDTATSNYTDARVIQNFSSETSQANCNRWSPLQTQGFPSINIDGNAVDNLTPYQITNFRAVTVNSPYEANDLSLMDVSRCRTGTANETGSPSQTGASLDFCYGTSLTMPKYVVIEEGQISQTNSLAPTILFARCNSYYESGRCSAWSTPQTLNSSNLNDTRLVHDFSSEERQENSYIKLDNTDFCSTFDDTNYRSNSSKVVKIACYGEQLMTPMLAGSFVKTATLLNTRTCGNASDSRNPTTGECWRSTATTWVGDALIGANQVFAADQQRKFCSDFAPFTNGITTAQRFQSAICLYRSDATVSFNPYYLYSGFSRSVAESKKASSPGPVIPGSVTDWQNINNTVMSNTYNPPTYGNSSCSAQGIYILSDGENNLSGYDPSLRFFQSALRASNNLTNSNTFNCTQSRFNGSAPAFTDWGCAAEFNNYLLDPTKNPARVKIQTATVGFGADYEDIPEYNPNLSDIENANLIRNYRGSTQNKRNLALLGVFGQGGWYKGNSETSIVNSINNFVNRLSVVVPDLSMGTITIPLDSLNPSAIQDKAYFPIFNASIQSNHPLWLGNVRKYGIVNGEVNFVEETGWEGGVLKNLPLKNLEAATQIPSRRVLYTNRGFSDSQFAGNKLLRKIDIDYRDSGDGKTPYLMAALGYSVKSGDLNLLPSKADLLASRVELRQMGGVLHSTPILLTQKGRITISADGLTPTSDQREEYLLFGTVQGLVQVINATTGVEKFAFLPNEILNSQPGTLLPKGAVTDQQGLRYGVDGPWTAYTEYVPAGSSGLLTVGTGVNSQKGKQYVYGGMRMGGRSYYGLDLSNIDDPKMLFHIDPTITTELAAMGQSWSKPTVGFIQWKGQRKMVMIVGGGYDMGYEAAAYNQTNGQGAGVYIFDAENGELLEAVNQMADSTKFANMNKSVVSRINTMDRNNDGLIDHLYFSDLGGQVWRVDIDNTAQARSDSTNKLANRATRLFNGTNNNGKNVRFYESPNLTVFNGGTNGRFVAVSVASGDRSSPLKNCTDCDSDGVFVIYDNEVTKTDLYSLASSNSGGVTAAELSDFNFTASIPVTNTVGWKYVLTNSMKAMGELVSVKSNLFVPLYDPNLGVPAQSCAGSAKGGSYVQRFCLPYGQCADSSGLTDNRLFVGSGIIGVNMGGGKTNAYNRRIVGGQCIGNNCTPSVPFQNKVNTELELISRLNQVDWTEQFARTDYTFGTGK